MARVAAIDDGGLTGEDARLLEALRLRLSLAGADLDDAAREELRGINTELASSRPPTRAASSRTPRPAPCSSRTASAWPV